MKAFEEWKKEYLNNQIVEHEDETYSIKPFDPEATWKAALEWVLKTSQCSGDNSDMFWNKETKAYERVGCDVRCVIRQELECEQ